MYEVSNKPFPFWGSETTSKTGRDPLAVQNSSVVIYDNMVKGVTNMTMRTLANNMAWLLKKIHANGQPDYPEREDLKPMNFIR